MKKALFSPLLGLASLGLAIQPSALRAIPAPLRSLELGTLNFLHTTDTHGWHAGHLQEASYGADWGDYVDFADRMRERIETYGGDLLIVDSGDRIEGNGLYDGSEPKGKYTFDIFTQQHMDVICIGNHELYKANSSNNDLNILVPAYHESYVASNLDIINPATGKWQPLAQRYRKFTTKNQGIRILAFGFLFDFFRNAKNTRVQPVEATVQEPWFQRVIRDDDIDLIVITAHIMARGKELQDIYYAIRGARPNIPIQFFGGHLHVRDYKKFDDTAYVLASGRFLETIGFQSIDGIVGGAGSLNTNTTTPPPTWSRRYIDNNLYSFYHHSGTNASTFHSPKGLAISAKIDKDRRALHLDHTFGCAPDDLWMSRVPFPSNNSIYTWLNESVLPEVVIDPVRRDKSRIVIVNTGAIRFDVFKGAFTTDTTFIISPFTSRMPYIKDVPFKQASQVTQALIDAAKRLSLPSSSLSSSSNSDPLNPLAIHRLAPPEQWHHHHLKPTSPQPFTNPDTYNHHNQHPLSPPPHQPQKYIPGYTTIDDLGQDGDDTIHTPIPSYPVPQVIQSYIPNTNTDDNDNDPPTVVDLIFNEYLTPFILPVLQTLGSPKNYTREDVELYTGNSTMTDLIARWIGENWGLECVGQ